MPNKKGLIFRIRKLMQVLKYDGLRELSYRVSRTLWRTIPLKKRIRLKKALYYRDSYSAVGDPLRVYNISPDLIDSKISKKELNWRLSEFEIKEGDWHRNKDSLENSKNYKMFKEHFLCNEPWSETENYRRVANRLKRGEKVSALDAPDQSIVKYEEYLSYFDRLYDSIKEEGYKRQKYLSAESDFVNRDIKSELNEVQVFIGPEGEFICKSGRHRVYIAKILKLDEIPVRTQVRHKEWQNIREEIKSTKSKEKLSKKARENINHPELQDIVPEDWLE